ncbi:hypothetical protein [Armatimonas sp.]|uniref:hypothetical protein n=1 Tax=Armatimonas sp. TaxID=1872638 RepID=UPI00286D299E|nr:hypothetical protein [Armatimonas sp.]
MRTKAKLILGALGFVAATTGLVIWQSTPPRLETIARRLPFTDLGHLSPCWISPHELVTVVGDGDNEYQLQVLNLTTGTQRTILATKTQSTLFLLWPIRLLTDASPDGRWLLLSDSTKKSKKIRKGQRWVQHDWLLLHPDGTGARHFSAPESLSAGPFWLPDSRGFTTYEMGIEKKREERTIFSEQVTYFTDGRVPTRTRLARYPDFQNFAFQVVVQPDGSIFQQDLEDSLLFFRIDRNQPEARTPYRFALPTGRESAEIQQTALTRDGQTLVATLRVQASAIPERETWEVLLKRKLTIAYDELWILPSGSQKAKLLLRQPVTSERNSSFSLVSVTPDSKYALLQGENKAYYLLPL